MSEVKTLKLEIPTDEIVDADSVKAEFERIYKELGQKPDEKAIALSGLASAIQLKDGSSLADRVFSDTLDVIDIQSDWQRQAALNATGALPPVLRAEHPAGDYIVVEVDPNAEIQNILTRTVLPAEDAKSIKAKRADQARTPSGPKQNSVSGGISRVDPKSRH